MAKIVNDSDFIFTHTWIDDENPGHMTPLVRVFGDTPEAVMRRMGHQFRLLDDDGNVYFHGRSGDDSSFEPLDYAGPRWGCTEIQYRNEETGAWDSL